MLKFRFSLVLNQLMILKSKILPSFSRRYTVITVILSQMLLINKNLYYSRLISYQQAIQIEQWFLQGWEWEKKRLCSASMKALERSFAEGSLLAEPNVVDLFLDLRALEDEGHYNQVLNELYGRGEAIFDALVYSDFGRSDCRRKQL